VNVQGKELFYLIRPNWNRTSEEYPVAFVFGGIHHDRLVLGSQMERQPWIKRSRGFSRGENW